MSVLKLLRGQAFRGCSISFLLITALFPFKRIISNKSPKLTPTRTDFTSKTAAAQLISALDLLISEFLVFLRLFRDSGFIAKLSAVKVWGFFSSVAQSLAFDFSGVSPVMQWLVCSSCCSDRFSPAFAKVVW